MMGLMASDETRTPKSTTAVSTAAPDAREPEGTGTRAVPERPSTRPWTAWTTRLLVLGIVLAALNLRPAITSLGALLEEVRDGLGMSGSVAGLLTSVPPLCFAVFGVTAPRLARRFGPGAVVCAGMAAIAAGLLIRPYAGGTPGFLAASALALMGIAVSNVLMPVIVKRWFPDRVGSMTGLYSMALAFGTSIAAAATVPLTDALGGHWQPGLAVWAVLAVAAVLPWLTFIRDREAPSAGHASSAAGESGGSEGQAQARPEPKGAAPAEGQPALRITRSRTAWALAVFFGLQATAAYITMGWMAQIFRDAGVSAGTAGLLLAVTMVMAASSATPVCTPPRPRVPGPGPSCSASPTAPSRSP
jgi:CP family cyanate transporter-like MFS transporter